MSAITSARSVLRSGTDPMPTMHTLQVKASTKIIAGALVCIDATGYAVNAATATGLIAVGIAQDTVDNTSGSSGALTIDVLSGVWAFNNSASGDLITVADRFATCYIVDNQTVAKTDGSAARSAAGKVQKIEGGLVYVSITPGV